MGIETALLVHAGATASAVAHGLFTADGSPSVAFARLLLSSSQSTGLLFVANCAIATVLLGAVLLRIVFLGRLSVLEAANAGERALSWVMLKTVGVAAIHSDSADSPELVAWALWGTAMGVLRVFTSLARDRVERQSSSVSLTFTERARTASLIAVLFALDALAARVVASVASDNLLTCWLLLYDTVIVALSLLLLSVRFGSHLYEVAGFHHSASSGERRRRQLYVGEIAIEVTTDALALSYTTTLLWMHGLSLHLVDAILLLHVRALVLSLWQRTSRFAGYLAVSRSLHKAFSDVPETELAAMDEVCAVCREQLDRAKRLPCGHMFHSLCLQRWLEVRTACPTCRRPLVGE